jgi:hypothetical protein
VPWLVHLCCQVAFLDGVLTKKNACDSESGTSWLGPSLRLGGTSSTAARAGSHNLRAACKSFKCPHLGCLSCPVPTLCPSIWKSVISSHVLLVLENISYFSSVDKEDTHTHTQHTIFIKGGIIVIACSDILIRCPPKVCASVVLHRSSNMNS